MRTNHVRQNGPAIREFRDSRGMTRAELARIIERTPSHLGNLEREQVHTTSAIMHRIATALDVPIAAILRCPIHAHTETSAA